MVEQLGTHQVVDLARPLVVAGHDVPQSALLRAFELSHGVEPTKSARDVAGLGCLLGGIAEQLTEPDGSELGVSDAIFGSPGSVRREQGDPSPAGRRHSRCSPDDAGLHQRLALSEPERGVDVGHARGVCATKVGDRPCQAVDAHRTTSTESPVEHLLLQAGRTGVGQRPLAREDRAREPGSSAATHVRRTGWLPFACHGDPLAHLERALRGVLPAERPAAPAWSVEGHDAGCRSGRARGRSPCGSSGDAAAGCTCTGCRGGWTSTHRRGRGCRPSPPGPGLDRWPTPHRGRSSPHRSRGVDAARRSRRSGTTGTRPGRAPHSGTRLTSPGRTLAGASAEEARLAGVVMRREERRSADQVVARLEGTGERVDRRELQRLLRRQVGQEAGKSLGQGGLARPLRDPTASGGDRRRLPPPSAYFTSGTPLRSERSCSVSRRDPRHSISRLPDIGATGSASGTGSPRSSARTWARERMPRTVIPGTIAASRACGSGTITRSKPRRDAAITIGRTPGTERSPPVSVSSPITSVSDERALADVAAGGQDGQRDREVEVGASLHEVGRRQQDRHATGHRPRHTGVVHCHPAPVARPRAVRCRADRRASCPECPGRRRPGRRSGGRAPLERDGVGGRERHQTSPGRARAARHRGVVSGPRRRRCGPRPARTSCSRPTAGPAVAVVRA